MSGTSTRAVVAGLACVWLLAVLAGLRVLWAYAGAAGDVAPAVEHWPMASTLSRDAQRPTLVMFIHPMCPCSAASADELARLLAQCGDRLSAQAVAILPQGAPPDWERAALVKKIGGIPGVKVVLDRGGGEAKAFGAVTSGHTCLYSPQGRLLFRGGITPARGHQGHNAGSDAILTLIGSGAPAPAMAAGAQSAVYGCSLMGRQSQTDLR